ncbi:MAG TPA: RidA family protein [Casimicrobiaceae bacterium]
MTIEFFEDSNAGTRTFPRSLVTKAGGFVFVSGQVARDERGDIVAGGIEVHTRQTMKNVARALAMAGCTLEDVVKTTVWLADARDYEDFNRVYSAFFPGNRPARSTIQAKNMIDTKVEIEAIAYKP